MPILTTCKSSSDILYRFPYCQDAPPITAGVGYAQSPANLGLPRAGERTVNEPLPGPARNSQDAPRVGLITVWLGLAQLKRRSLDAPT